MNEITHLDSKRVERKTTLERIFEVFDTAEELEDHHEGTYGVVVYGYKDEEGANYFAVATGGDAPTSNYLGLMSLAGYYLFQKAQEGE